MRYIAEHYMQVNGAFVTRGEIIEANFPAEQEERLLRLGAIRKADAPFPSPENTVEGKADGEENGGPSPVSENEGEPEEAPEGEDMEPVEETLAIDPLEDVTPAKETKKGKKKE